MMQDCGRAMKHARARPTACRDRSPPVHRFFAPRRSARRKRVCV